MNVAGSQRWLVNIDSGNGLVPPDNKPFTQVNIDRSISPYVSQGRNELTLDCGNSSALVSLQSCTKPSINFHVANIVILDLL